jgi:aryl-alcohol dehydrogenase-like predicted oxidoreductase
MGSTKIRHLEDAVSSLSVKLTSEEITRLEELYIPHPFI